jgi:hypothetical protein
MWGSQKRTAALRRGYQWGMSNVEVALTSSHIAIMEDTN